MTEINRICEEYNSKLKSTDQRFGGTVIVKSMFGHSIAVCANAFALKYKDWILIFSEHDECRAFHQDDYSVVFFKSRSDIKELKIK